MSKIVKRTLDFFELFEREGRALTLSEISRALKLPVSSCHDVLRSLLDAGYLYQLGPRSAFYPNLKLKRLAGVIVEHDPVVLRAEILLRELRARFDETVFLMRAEGAGARYLLSFESASPLRFFASIGDSLRSVHATSAGKAALGALPPEERRAAIAALDMQPLTGATIRSADTLAAEIEASVARGWYLNREESVPTVTTVSATFRWNRATYIVTVAGPTHRMEPRLEQVGEALLEVCRGLERPSSPVQIS